MMDCTSAKNQKWLGNERAACNPSVLEGLGEQSHDLLEVSNHLTTVDSQEIGEKILTARIWLD